MSPKNSSIIPAKCLVCKIANPIFQDASFSKTGQIATANAAQIAPDDSVNANIA